MAEFAGLASIQALALALVHFLWQGALVGIAAALLFRAFARASTRYAIGIAAMLVMLAVPAATFFVSLGAQAPAVLEPINAVALANQVASGTLTPAESAAGFETAAGSGWWPAAGVVAWIAGMLVLSVRLAGGWLVARRMATHAVKPAAEQVQAVARSLAERLALGRAVQVFESTAVAVPVLVGWLRPAVVFPVAALAGLSPVQIEALLAHELAHVRRHDYLVNLLQSLAEIVLFYHPAVWWLSRRIRTERELCCDDLAVGLCDRLVYATALTDLAAMRSPRVALAATGGDLLTRVRRILEREEAPMSHTRWIPALIVSALILAIVPVTLASVKPAPAQEQTATAPIQVGAAVPVAEAVAPESLEAAEPTESVEPGEPVEPQSQSPEQRARQLEELRKMLDRLQSELAASEIDQKKLERSELASRLEELAARQSVEDAKKSLDRMQRMFEVGLASQSQLEEVRKALKFAEAAGDQRKLQEVETEALEQQLAEARKQMERGLLSQNDFARLEAELAQSRLRRAASEIRNRAEDARERGRRDSDSAAELQSRARTARAEDGRAVTVEQERRLRDVTAELERQGAASSREFERRRQEVLESRARAELREVAPERLATREALEPVASRPIVAGDFLFVSFEGESQLPTIYRIEGNGTIRVPLLGTFKVIGQTPGQVRETIGKKLMDAKLGSPAKVSVELRQERRVR